MTDYLSTKNHHSLRFEENPLAGAASSFDNTYSLLYSPNTSDLASVPPTPTRFFDFDFSTEFEQIKTVELVKPNTTSLPGLSPTTKKISKVFHIITEPRRNIKQKDQSDRGDCSRRAKQVRWSSAEDNQIRELIAQFGEKWAVLSKIVGTRTGKQIRDRYNNYLRSDITNAKFTQEEDSRLLQLFEEFGSKWAQIAEHMPGRTEAQVKNRYYSHLKKNLSSEDSLCLQAEKGILSSTEEDTNRQELSDGVEEIFDPTDLISYSVQHYEHREDEDRFTKFIQSIIDCDQELNYKIPEFPHTTGKTEETHEPKMRADLTQAEINEKLKGLYRRKSALEFFHRKIVKELKQ